MAEPSHATQDANAAPPALVEATDIARYFDVSKPALARLIAREPRRTLRAVDGVSFAIPKGRTLSLVGESGCGKSTVARMVVGLYRPTRGRMVFDGTDVTNPESRGSGRGSIRRRMQMIFQDPYASLNPRWRVGDTIAEPLHAFGEAGGRSGAEQHVARLLTQVGLSPADAEKFPHEFSGGQRQRISIARALASQPEFLVCDEPTSALDVSVQAQILNLMKDLQSEFGLTYLFISHNLAVVRHMSDVVGVMYLGRIVETAPAETVFQSPRHPYTRMLMDALPDIAMTGRARVPVGGEVPNPISPPTGCHFHPRCPLANDRCRRESPSLREAAGTKVACHAVEEGRA